MEDREFTTEKKDFGYSTRAANYLISWVKAGGDLNDPFFREWISSRPLTAEAVDEILALANENILDLETSAKIYIRASEMESKDIYRRIKCKKTVETVKNKISKAVNNVKDQTIHVYKRVKEDLNKKEY